MNSLRALVTRLPGLLLLATGMTAAVPALSADSAPEQFAPLGVTLQPNVTASTLPSWFSGSIGIHPESDAVEFPVPALATQNEIGCFALTVVFEDNGDGGPVVEWAPKGGDSLLLSAGLGEHGVAIGLNARTLLLPQQLALDGGVLRVSFAGRFARLLSATLRPARELGVAALGNELQPALIEGKDRVLEETDVSGADEKPVRGDRTEGRVIKAELAALPTRLDDLDGGGLEVVVPMTKVPDGAYLHAEIGGLDPESWVEVTVNGESFGPLGAAPFSFADPRVIFSPAGRLLLAGWRPASLYLPARLLKEGENSVVFTLHRAAGDAGRAVYLRNARLDLLFGDHAPASSAAPSPSPAPAAPSAGSTLPPEAADQDPETLSTGSLYGNPAPEFFRTTPLHPMQEGAATPTPGS